MLDAPCLNDARLDGSCQMLCREAVELNAPALELYQGLRDHLEGELARLRYRMGDSVPYSGGCPPFEKQDDKENENQNHYAFNKNPVQRTLENKRRCWSCGLYAWCWIYGLHMRNMVLRRRTVARSARASRVEPPSDGSCDLISYRERGTAEYAFRTRAERYRPRHTTNRCTPQRSP